MTSRNKDVMIYRYDPKKKFFLVSLHLENKPGALGNVADLLAIRGINILEGFFGGLESGPKGVLSFFLETTNLRMDENWLKDLLMSSVFVSDVEVRSGVEGFLADTANFPVTWNSGDRAVVLRMGSLRAMLNAVRESHPNNAEEALYNQGFNFGYPAWQDILGVHRPKTTGGFAEMLKIHSATGWGRVELVELDAGHKRAKLTLRDGFECSDVSSQTPVGTFTCGHLAGVMSAFFETIVKGTEVKCTARGDEICEFDFAPEQSPA